MPNTSKNSKLNQLWIEKDTEKFKKKFNLNLKNLDQLSTKKTLLKEIRENDSNLSSKCDASQALQPQRVVFDRLK